MNSRRSITRLPRRRGRAGGTGTDSFAVAVAHKESQYVLDLARERKPRFVPAQVIAEFAALLKDYDISGIQSDKYAIGFHEAEWRSHGIKLTACERTTSENYLSILPMMLAKRCCLVDNMTLRSQLAALERRVGEKFTPVRLPPGRLRLATPETLINDLATKCGRPAHDHWTISANSGQHTSQYQN
jgi:hypothetical protein